MRCRNCHTQLMATDTHCPSCRSSVGRATSAAPGEIRRDNDGLLRMLPMFGGAAGGLLYGAIKAAEASVQPTARRPAGMAPAAAGGGSGRFSVRRFLVGLVCLLGGGLFVFIGGREAWNARAVSQRVATDVTTAELGRLDFAKSAPDWVRYSFEESKPTGVAVKRARQGSGVPADARCLLVRVGKIWLIATVPPDFEGTELTGYVVPFDPVASRSMIEQVVKAEPTVAALLPFEFNGVEGSAADQRLRYTVASLLGFVGLVGVLIGVYVIPFGNRSRTAAVPLGAAS